LKNFGVMTDERLLEIIQEESQKKEQERIFKETLKKMKTENKENKKREVAEKQMQRQQKRKTPDSNDAPQKKRGRPPKLQNQ
jgi:uncharacterized membrane-anchored protein YjiN (DUF445 family)